MYAPCASCQEESHLRYGNRSGEWLCEDCYEYEEEENDDDASE